MFTRRLPPRRGCWTCEEMVTRIWADSQGLKNGKYYSEIRKENTPCSYHGCWDQGKISRRVRNSPCSWVGAVSFFMVSREHAFECDTDGQLWNDLPYGPWRMHLKFLKKQGTIEIERTGFLFFAGGGVSSWWGKILPGPQQVKLWGGDK